ncbi:MAG: hypothetical protein AB8B80_04265 [Marinicellaceae bacterium]
MARLVHITAEENKKKVLNSGIKPNQYGLVYFMPHMESMIISHQWARELKRSGIKNFIAIDFKLPKVEMVWYGKYSGEHKLMPLNQAISLFMKEEDQLGFEFFIKRKIEVKEIKKVKQIPKPIGWRYQPHAHGTKPCPCPMCMQFGGYKTNALKEKQETTMSRNEAKEIIANNTDEDQILDAIMRLRGKWKNYSPQYLEHLIEMKDEYAFYYLILLLVEHRHPKTIEILQKLTQHPNDEIKEDAKEELEKLDLQDYGIR